MTADALSITIRLVKRISGPVTETTTVRLNRQVTRCEVIVAIDAGLILVTTATKLWICSGCDRMRHLKITAVHIPHRSGKITLFVGKPCLMAFQAEILLMAGRTVVHVRFGRRSMAESPEGPVAVECRQFNRVGKCLIMALEAYIQRWNDALISVDVTG
jgi:hypothetical protein